MVTSRGNWSRPLLTQGSDCGISLCSGIASGKSKRGKQAVIIFCSYPRGAGYASACRRRDAVYDVSACVLSRDNGKKDLLTMEEDDEDMAKVPIVIDGIDGITPESSPPLFPRFRTSD